MCLDVDDREAVRAGTDDVAFAELDLVEDYRHVDILLITSFQLFVRRVSSPFQVRVSVLPSFSKVIVIVVIPRMGCLLV